MSTMFFIRTSVFAITQREMADIAGVTQATVSRWESGHWEPSRDELCRIRDEARKRRLKFRDAWFFAPPTAPASLPQVVSPAGA